MRVNMKQTMWAASMLLRRNRADRLSNRWRLVVQGIAVALVLIVVPQQGLAAKQADVSALRDGVVQPYIVKKGDTLWDIANHFFRDPMKWLKIWERNLYITNPDLIYPGNKIWFDGKRMRQGGLTQVRPQPQVVVRPVERLEGQSDASVLLTALQRQGFIQPDQIEGVGHVIDSLDERLNYGANDRVYLKLNSPAKAGDLFDVFRSTETLRDPATGAALGVLIIHLGQIRIESSTQGVYRGLVTKAFEEISRGDRLMPARSIDPHIVPTSPETLLSGRVLYIRNGMHEAAQHQVVGVNLGRDRGVQAGMQFSIYRHGRVVSDTVAGSTVALPEERIGTVLVMVAQPQASIALVTESDAPIAIGDLIRGGEQQAQ